MKIKNILVCSAIACSLTVGVGIVKESINHELVTFARAISPSDSKQELQAVVISDPQTKVQQEEVEGAVSTFVDSAKRDKDNDDSQNDTLYIKRMKIITKAEKATKKDLKAEKNKLTNQDYQTLKQYYKLVNSYLEAGKQYGEDIATNGNTKASKSNMDDAHTQWMNMYKQITAGSPLLKDDDSE